MRLPLDLSNGGWHMPKSLNFRHVNRYSEDRTSLVHLAAWLDTPARKPQDALREVTQGRQSFRLVTA